MLEGASATATARLGRKARVVCCTASAAATLPLRLARAFASEDKGGGEAEGTTRRAFRLDLLHVLPVVDGELGLGWGDV